MVLISDNLLKRLRLFESQVHAAASEKFEHLYVQDNDIATANIPADAVEVPGKVQRYYRGTLIEE